jgi:hypothetical protein
VVEKNLGQLREGMPAGKDLQAGSTERKAQIDAIGPFAQVHFEGHSIGDGRREAGHHAPKALQRSGRDEDRRQGRSHGIQHAGQRKRPLGVPHGALIDHFSPGAFIGIGRRRNAPRPTRS